MSDLAEVVTRTIAEVARCDPGDLTVEKRLAEDLMLKSVSRIELAALLEDRLRVAITNFDIRKPRTVGEMIEMVKAKLS